MSMPLEDANVFMCFVCGKVCGPVESWHLYNTSPEGGTAYYRGASLHRTCIDRLKNERSAYYTVDRGAILLFNQLLGGL